MAEPRPFLTFGSPQVSPRVKNTNKRLSLENPTPAQQRERLLPQFQHLQNSFDHHRVQLVDDPSSASDPALVLVFELKYSVADFHKAVSAIDGLEFLSEFLDPASVRDLQEEFEDQEDIETINQDTSNSILYLLMSNKSALDQLLGLFRKWTDDPEDELPKGLAPLRNVFKQLRSIRPWGPEDRIRESGILERWQQELYEAEGFPYRLLAEIELWYRNKAEDRAEAEGHVTRLINGIGGNRCLTGSYP